STEGGGRRGVPKLQRERAGRQQVLRQLRHRAAAHLSNVWSFHSPREQILFRVRRELSSYRARPSNTERGGEGFDVLVRRAPTAHHYVLRHSRLDRTLHAA